MVRQELPLAGCRVLIVEDEYLLADDLSRMLEKSGAHVIGPVGNVADAMRQVMNDGFEAVIIDLNLGSQMAYPVADELARQNIPFVFATGYDKSAIPARFADVRRWEKPFDERRLVADLARLCPRTPS